MANALGTRRPPSVVSRHHRQWLLRPGRRAATAAEAHRRLPGDDLLAEPATQITRGVTVEAPPEEVWRWVIQIGADRGGFYSYDWLENLFGLGIHSADRVVAEWQQRSVGDLVFADAKGSGGWYVAGVWPGEALALKLADVKRGRPLSRTDRWGWEFLWTFALQPAGAATTRLLVRERVAFGSRTVRLGLAPVRPVSAVMTARMLLGIKTRAEAGRSRREHPEGPSAARSRGDGLR